jgi:hypothetical protein
MSTGFQTDAFQLDAFQILAGDTAGTITGTANQQVLIGQTAAGTVAQVAVAATGGMMKAGGVRKKRAPASAARAATAGRWVSLDSEDAKQRLARWAAIDAELERDAATVREAEAAVARDREETKERARKAVIAAAEKAERERIAALPKCKGLAAQSIGIVQAAAAQITTKATARQAIGIRQTASCQLTDTIASLRNERDALRAKMAKMKRDNDALTVLLMAA